MQRYQLTRRNQPATSTTPVYHASGLFAIVLPPSLPPSSSLLVVPYPWIFVSETEPPPPFCLCYSSFHGSSFINLSFSPRIFHPFPPTDTCHSLFIISCSFPPLSFVPVSLARSIITGGAVIRSTIAGHKLASKTVALDPAGFTPLYKPGRTLA